MPGHRKILLSIAALGTAGLVLAAAGGMAARSEEKRWQAVAPGRVEACSGQIKLGAVVPGVVDKVLVKANHRVFAGEPLIRLVDGELAGRLAAAEAQMALRKRARDEKSATGRAGTLRKARDAKADAEDKVYAVRAIVDRTAAEWRAKGGSSDSLTKARSALAGAKVELAKREEELQALEDDAPLPSVLDGQFNVARSEYAVARSALDNMTVRAPADGTVLQVNVHAGEPVSPGSPQPLLQLADISALCVRAELDERDLAFVGVKQIVSVRAAAFPDKELNGKVVSIAPLVGPGRMETSGPRNQSDVNVVEVMIELKETGQSLTGMKVDVYFKPGETAGR